MKKLTVLLLVFVMLISVGCGGSGVSPLAGQVTAAGDMSTADTGQATPGTITLKNDTAYSIMELYSTASSSTEFGAELLGAMTITSGTSVSLDIGNINELQDLLMVDDEGDSYSILGIPFVDGGTVTIAFQADTSTTVPMATVYDASGTELSTTTGVFIPADNTNATGYDTNGYYTFTVNNYSSYDIYSIHVGIAGSSASYDIDILPQVLPSQNALDVTGFATQGDWLNTEWTLYITDVDGDTSASYDSFNPWSLTSVDVNWDSNAGGYTTSFNY